jgi:hypothetical protein
MLMLPPVQNVVAQHSFTGSHMVAYADDPKLERGMLMSITRDGTLVPSLEVGGSVGVEKAPSVSIRSTDPQIVHHFEGQEVFGVFDSIVTNQWYSGGVHALE